MKITTRGRYGLRAMLGLARQYGQPPVLMSALAQGEQLSLKYLHALLAALKRAGLVESTRGAGGGFQLSRAPADIRLNEILRAVEGPLCLVDCVERAQKCKKSANCTARRVWQRLSNSIEQVLGEITLQDLLEDEEEVLAVAGRQKQKAGSRYGVVRRPRNADGRR